MSDDSERTELSGRMRIGEWTVDPALDEIARDGETIKLEPRKMLLLVALARRAGEVVTPDQLLDLVWPGVVVTQSSVYQSVAQLRKTLGDSRSTPEYIATVPRKGYRLIAPVRFDRDPDLPESPGEPAAPVDPIPAPPPDRPPHAARRRWLLGGGIAGAAIVAAGGAWWWSRPASSIDGIVRIAVLPFADRSEGGIEQAAADGLANDVIHRFERSPAVLVLARNSTFTFRTIGDQPEGLRLLKQQLNADYAMLGELFRTRERIRVAVRLVSVASGKVAWTGTFAKPEERLAELPEAIAAGALKALGLEAGPPPERNPLAAYELYLLGLHALTTQRSIEGIRKARDYFQHAIDTDATYARAYAGLATTWLSQANYGVGIEVREAGARAQPLLDKSLAIDPQLLEGLLAQGRLYLFTHWDDASRARGFMQKAVDLYPGSAEARFGLGTSYAFDARPREAIPHYVSALELDPLNYVIHSRWGQDATFLGDFEAARVHFARAATLSPKYPWRFLGPGQADYARGRLDDAVVNYRLQFEQDPRRPDAWGELGWMYLDLGMPAEARIAFATKADLSGRAAQAGLDAAYTALAEGKAATLPALLAERGIDHPIDGQPEVDRMMVQAIAGKLPTDAQVAALHDRMRADSVPWVGSYWVFLGFCNWIDLAALHDLAGSSQAAHALLDDAQAMLVRLKSQGNAFHSIPFLEARIAALRNQHDLAFARLGTAVDAGWRRAWWIAHDPAFRRLRDDPRVATLVARVRRDTDAQRTHVG